MRSETHKVATWRERIRIRAQRFVQTSDCALARARREIDTKKALVLHDSSVRPSPGDGQSRSTR